MGRCEEGWEGVRKDGKVWGRMGRCEEGWEGVRKDGRV